MIQKEESIKVYYIYHSGFLAETPQAYYLFDYCKGVLPRLDTRKPVFVFVSHGHSDHYNPEIFSLLRAMGMEDITAILSNDIPKKHYPSCLLQVSLDALDEARVQDRIPAVRVYHSREYELPFQTKIQTLLSTDKGVAYLLVCPEGTLFHAGDLNDWIMEGMPEQERRRMTGSYKASISALKGKTIDIAFFPLDPRLGAYYAKGFLAFLKTADVKRVYPMHYWDQPEIMEHFRQEYPEYESLLFIPAGSGPNARRNKR